MRSKAEIYHHPLHPMLVAFPIGLAVWGVVATILYAASNDNLMWYDIAYYTTIATIISGLVAALPGLTDYLLVASRTDAKVPATLHLAANLVFLGLYFVSFLLMIGRNAASGGSLTAVVILQLLGVGILGLSGWLGGELVYRHHLGMVPDDAQREAEELTRHRITAGQSRAFR